METETIWLTEMPGVPNNPRLPVLLHRGVWNGGGAAAEPVFASHGWLTRWRGGLEAALHFHTAAHEALAFLAGAVTLRLGGMEGPERVLRAGDVLVLPAGTGHAGLEATPDLLVAGAYPGGQEPDMTWPFGSDREGQRLLAAARARIARLPDPPGCPVHGAPYPRRP